MLNWTTGEGTAKYWVTKLLIETADIDNDQAVITKTNDINEEYIFSQAFIGKNNRRWVLIVNKRYANIDIVLPQSIGGIMKTIDEQSGFGPAVETTLTSNNITLNPFSVSIIYMPSTTIQ